MKRIRRHKDGSVTEYRPASDEGPYRVEIEVNSADDLRKLKRDGKIIAIRMVGTPKGKKPQYSLAPVDEVEDFTW